MSRTAPSDVEQAELLFGCDICPAGPGEWCRTEKGQPAKYLHNPRWERCMDVIHFTGWMEEERCQRELIVRLRRGIADIRDSGQRDIRLKCDQLLGLH